jgi:hypothetical protein
MFQTLLAVYKKEAETYVVQNAAEGVAKLKKLRSVDTPCEDIFLPWEGYRSRS